MVVADVTRISLDPAIAKRWLDMAHAFGVEVISMANDLDAPREAKRVQAVVCVLSKFLGE